VRPRSGRRGADTGRRPMDRKPSTALGGGYLPLLGTTRA
jgi:hypothetical protein